MTLPHICFRVDFADWCSVGIGKIELLEAIGRSGSLSRAARDMDMSYRRAWLLINSMNTEFDTRVVSATIGGAGGGGATLTDFGQQLIRAYRELELKLAALTEQHMRDVSRHIGAHRRRLPPSVVLRQSITRTLRPTTS